MIDSWRSLTLDFIPDAGKVRTGEFIVKHRGRLIYHAKCQKDYVSDSWPKFVTPMVMLETDWTTNDLDVDKLDEFLDLLVSVSGSTYDEAEDHIVKYITKDYPKKGKCILNVRVLVEIGEIV